MARIRSIKPEFWTDEKVVALSPLARLLFVGMWNFVDDEGRAEFSPMRMKMQILPADNANIAELLGEIRRERLVVVYDVEGKQYFEVCGFTKHQKIDHRSKSKYPSPTESPRNPPPDQGGDQGKERIKEESSEAKASAADAAPAVVPIDARTALFREGLEILRSMSGKPDSGCRQLLGKWLKACGDDAAAVLATIRRAAALHPAEPVAWIEKCFRPTDPDASLYRGVDSKPLTAVDIEYAKANGLT